MKIKRRILLQAVEYAKNAAATDGAMDILKKILINVTPKEDETLNFYYSTNLSPIIMKNDDYLYCVLPIRG